MSLDDTYEPSTTEASEPAPTPDDSTKAKSGWTRRTFLKAAAALGATSAGAGLVGQDGRGLHFGPMSAFAQDLSGNSCTAQDMDIAVGSVIPGTGTVCTACNNNGSGTFSAVVGFLVTNSASATRFCLAIHLPDGTDFILRDTVAGAQSNSGDSSISGKTAKTMYALVTGIPCTSPTGLVCFGQVPPTNSNKCAPGTCATLAWNTAQGAANCTTADPSPSPGQCRHKQICFKTFSASLACASGAADCSPFCGGTTSLKATLFAPDAGPFVYHLNGSDGSTQAYPTSGSTTDLSHTFTVSPPLGHTTYTVTICDLAGGQADGACCRTSNAVALTVSPPGAPTLSNTPPTCDGTTTVTATPNGGTAPFSYVWTPTGGTATTNADGSGSYTIKLPQGATTPVGVTVTDAHGCSATNSIAIAVNPPITVPAPGVAGPDCSGTVTLTANPSGGTGTYSTFQWFDGTTSIGTGNPLILALAPGDHSITVKVTDSAGCSATSAATPVHVNQPVNTALDTGSTPDCHGNVTFTASATGGTGVYTFAWKIDGNSVNGNTSSTLAYPPTVDCAQHHVAVTATDSNGCPSQNTATRAISQVVTTTVS